MTGGQRSEVRLVSCRALRLLAGRTTLRLGTRRVPILRSAGIAGYHVALLVALVAGFRAHVNPVAVLGLSGAAAVSFFFWALLRRGVTGRETLVLLEHVWVAGAAVAGFCLAAGVDLRGGIDVLACGLAVFLAAGRVGCFAAGCCYGVPAAVGVAYPPDVGLPARLVGVSLLPVQLIEAAALLAIGTVCLALAGGRPGEAAVWFLLAYAVVRFGTESLRADDRPSVLGVSIPRWMCLLQAAGASILAVYVIPGAGGRVAVAAAAVLAPAALAGLVLAAKRRPTALTHPETLDETWSVIESLAGTGPTAACPAVATTHLGVRIAASLLPGADGAARDVHVSLSAPDRPLADLLAVGDALAGREVRPGKWSVHFRIEGVRLRALQRLPEQPAPLLEPDRRITVREFNLAGELAYADVAHHKLSENRQDASVASPGNRLPTATPGTR